MGKRKRTVGFALKQASSPKRKVLIVTHAHFKWWVEPVDGFDHRTRADVEVDVEYLLSAEGFEDLIKDKQNDNKKYDCVVIAPCHGVVDSACLVWCRSGTRVPTADFIKAASLVTDNVHLCACSQGKFVRRLIKDCDLAQLSGYKGSLGAVVTNTEAFQIQYILAGCPYRNKFCRSRNNFICVTAVQQ